MKGELDTYVYLQSTNTEISSSGPIGKVWMKSMFLLSYPRPRDSPDWSQLILFLQK